MYADDTQVCGFCRPTAVTALTANITDCVEAATSWMRYQQASAKSRQYGVAVVRDHSATASATDVVAADRRLVYHSSPVCSRPAHLRRLRPVDADTRPTYRVAMLRRATSTTSDPSLCAVGHTSDARGCTGALPAGLWERCAGRPSSLSDASTPVGPERGGSTDLSPDDPRPHH